MPAAKPPGRPARLAATSGYCWTSSTSSTCPRTCLRSRRYPTARLFVRRDGRTLRARHLHAACASVRRAAELPGAHLHDLRHAGLPLAAQSGVTLAEVMRRAGHSSSRAAMIYRHAAERRDAEVAARLGHLAAGATPNRTGT